MRPDSTGQPPANRATRPLDGGYSSPDCSRPVSRCCCWRGCSPPPRSPHLTKPRITSARSASPTDTSWAGRSHTPGCSSCRTNGHSSITTAGPSTCRRIWPRQTSSVSTGGRTSAGASSRPQPVTTLRPPTCCRRSASLSPTRRPPALWLSRLADALPCALLLALSASLLWGGGGLSLLGLLGALTPMVLFVCSVVNPSGLETAASLAFAAACLRLTRGVEPGPRWVWAALALSGALAILAWQAGPAFVALDAVPALALLQWRRLGGAVSLRGRRVMLAAGTLLTAVALWLVYSRVSGVGHTRVRHPADPRQLSGGPGSARSRAHATRSGNFGSLTIHLPAGARWLWWLFARPRRLGALCSDRPARAAAVAATVLVVLAVPGSRLRLDLPVHRVRHAGQSCAPGV